LDYLSVPGGDVQDLNGQLVEKYIDRNVKEGKDVFIEIYDDSLQTKISRELVNKLSEEGRHLHQERKDVAFGRINSVNQSPGLVNFKHYPIYMYVDNREKKIYYHPVHGKNEFEVKDSFKKFRDYIVDVNKPKDKLDPIQKSEPLESSTDSKEATRNEEKQSTPEITSNTPLSSPKEESPKEQE